MRALRKISRKILTEASYSTGKFLVPPEFVSLILTLGCNFRCDSCSVWKLPKEQHPLSEEKWLSVARELARILRPSTFVELNGGEALLEAELVASLTRELKKYFHRVTLNSNGSLFTRKRAKQLRQAGLDTVKLSLYSLEKEIHDELRGHQGAFESARLSIPILQSVGIHVEVGILVTSKNIHSIPDLVRWLAEKGIPAILQPLDESIESNLSKDSTRNALPKDLWPAREQTEKFFEWAKNHSSLFKNAPNALETMRRYFLDPESVLSYRCFAGQRSIIIYPNGNAQLCFKRKPIGNVAQMPIRSILKSERATLERKGIAHCSKYCRIIGCNFSRGFREVLRETLFG